MLEKLKEELVQLHLELPKNNLVAWTSGNISGARPADRLRGNQTERYSLRRPDA